MDFNKFIVVTNIFLILRISDKRNVYMFQKVKRILNTYKKDCYRLSTCGYE